jgi:D-alanyl-D-alanine carboxypeptidase
MQARLRVIAVGMLLAAVLSGCDAGRATSGEGSAATSAPAASSRPLPAADTATLDAIATDAMHSGAVPGMAVGVWIPGRGDLVRTYGVSDVSTKAPFTADDHVRIASITKTFTATAALVLVDQGKLRLDDRLETFVPGVPNGPDIAVAQLLNMTSGIFDFTTDPAFSDAFDTDPLAPFPLERVLEILRRQPPAFAPGAAGQWQYSDSNYILLGEIIGQVSGQDAGAFIQHEIVDRLALPGTSYPTTPDMPSPAARGYVIVPAGQPERDVTAVNPAVPGTAGAMISTLEGLHAWAPALAEGRLLSPESHRVQTTFVQAKLSPQLRTGYGAGLISINDFVGHNGAIYGYNTAMFYLPDAGATIVVVANKSTNSDGVATATFLKLAQAYFPEKFAS